MKITVIGTGYVGLVTGACLADVGIEVSCVDIDQKKIEQLKKGIIPIYEPGLDAIVLRNINNKRLHFTTQLQEVIEEAEAIFIAVGTPPKDNGSAELKYVMQVAAEIGMLINNYKVVITKSTVPVGTNQKIKEVIEQQIKSRGKDISFSMVSNPEFLKEGAAIADFMRPDRVVVGVEDEAAKEIMERIYKPIQLSGERLVYMDIVSAEITKYAANAMLATKISFMNDMANLCELVGADINMVRNGIGTDARIGKKFIYAGVGYGGSCFPKDVKAIVNTAKEYNYQLRVLEAVDQVNEDQKYVMVQKIKKHFGDNLTGKKFAVWGLSFKPNTDDMRDAPSIIIINELVKAGAAVSVYDPISMEQAQKFYIGDKAAYTQNSYDALHQADALLLITEWPEFRIPDWQKVAALLKNKVVFDGRNIYDQQYLQEMGFAYFGIGRKN